MHPLDRLERGRNPPLHVREGKADGLGAEIETHEASPRRQAIDEGDQFVVS